MDDKDKKLQALYNLEMCVTGRPVTREQMVTRIWAALYLIQSMGGGAMPENYQQVMEDAHALDAEEITQDAIRIAKET